MNQNPIAEAVIKRDRNIVLTGLAAIILVAATDTNNMTRTYNGMAAAMLQQHDYAAHGSESLW